MRDYQQQAIELGVPARPACTARHVAAPRVRRWPTRAEPAASARLAWPSSGAHAGATRRHAAPGVRPAAPATRDRPRMTRRRAPRCWPERAGAELRRRPDRPPRGAAGSRCPWTCRRWASTAPTRSRDARPARRLRAAPAAADRGPAAHRRRRLDRRRQVDAGQLPGRAAGSPSPGVLRPTTRSPVLVHHPDDVAWFDRRADPPGPARAPGRHRRPRRAAAGGRRHRARGPGRSSTPPTSTRSRRATARWPPSCWRPRTSGSSSPRRRATPTRCRGTSCGPPPSAAPPSRSCWTAPPPQPSTRCRPTSARMLRRARAARTRRCSPSTEGAVDEAACCPPEARRARSGLAGAARGRRRRPRRGRAPDPRRRGPVVARRPTRWPTAADAQVAMADRLRADVERAYDEAGVRSTGPAPTARLLRGEVLARWQEFVGTGELLRVAGDQGRLGARPGRRLRSGASRSRRSG